jgi:MFS family permease
MTQATGFSALAPFRVRNYRLQWPADLMTAWAFEMETMLLSWYVLTQSNSVFLMAAIPSLQLVGTLFAPIFGVFGDRIGLRNLLCLMRAFYAVNAVLLCMCAYFGVLNVPIAFAVAFMMGLVRPSDLGVRTALVANTVSPAVLPSAMGLSRTTFDSARIFAALSGAGLFAAFGMATAYALVSICYIGGFVMTLMMTPPKPPEAGEDVPRVVIIKPSPFRDLLEGLGYVWRTPHLWGSMCLACLVNLTAFPSSLGLAPFVARDVLGGDEIVLGHLLASFAVGALTGSIIMMLRRAPANPARPMLVFAVIWHVCLIVFAVSKFQWLSMAALFGAGLCQSLSMLSLLLLLLQTSAPRLRGRVMGVRMMAIYSLPIGLTVAGLLIPRFGFEAVGVSYALLGLLLTIAIGVSWWRSLWMGERPAPS